MKKNITLLFALLIFFSHVKEGQSVSFVVSDFRSFEFPGASWTIGRGINNSKEIVGEYIDGSGINGFRYDGNSFTTFNSTFSQWRSTAHGINDNGKIVGQWLDANNYHGYVYDEETDNFTSYEDIVPGSTSTSFRDINNNDKIVGFYWDTNGFDHGLLYDVTTGDYDTLDPDPSVGPFTNSIASGINDSGHVVGGFWDSAISNSQRGYYYNGTNFISILVPGAVQTHTYGINNSGLIAGTSSIAGHANGFLYDGVDFTTIMLPGALNTTVLGINDSGQIVGHYDDGNTNNPKGFVASYSAVPEPTTIALLGIGLAGIAGGVLKRRFKKREEQHHLLKQMLLVFPVNLLPVSISVLLDEYVASCDDRILWIQFQYLYRQYLKVFVPGQEYGLIVF